MRSLPKMLKVYVSPELHVKTHICNTPCSKTTKPNYKVQIHGVSFFLSFTNIPPSELAKLIYDAVCDTLRIKRIKQRIKQLNYHKTIFKEKKKSHYSIGVVNNIHIGPVNFLNSPTIGKCGRKLILDPVCNTRAYIYLTMATSMLTGSRPVLKTVQICC